LGWTAYGKGTFAAGGGYDADGAPEYGSGIETVLCKICHISK